MRSPSLGDDVLVRVEELLHHWHELVTSEIGVRQAQQVDEAKKGLGDDEDVQKIVGDFNSDMRDES